MQEETKEKKCADCIFFTQLYARKAYEFKIINQGVCDLRDTFVKPDGKCDKYKLDTSDALKDFFVKKRLSEILAEISALRRLLEGDNK